MQYRILFLLVSVMTTAIFTSAQTPPITTELPKSYMIGPGDVISIKAIGEPTFDVEGLIVEQDGRIIIPFSDEPFVAKCKTERQLQAEVIKAWSRYIRSPQLNLRVTERNSRPPVSIYGAVVQQQKLELTRRATLLELVSFAGLTERNGTVQVFRMRPPMCDEGNESSNWTAASTNGLNVPTRTYSLKMLQEGNEDSNPEILPGDVIMVQKPFPVYVMGEVVKPGEFSIPEAGLPLTEAIAMAFGVSREAKSKNVRIYRKGESTSEAEVIMVNYDQIRKGKQKDVLLRPYDIVEVDKARKSIGDILLEAVTGIPGRVPIPLRTF